MNKKTIKLYLYLYYYFYYPFYKYTKKNNRKKIK